MFKQTRKLNILIESTQLYIPAPFRIRYLKYSNAIWKKLLHCYEAAYVRKINFKQCFNRRLTYVM